MSTTKQEKIPQAIIYKMTCKTTGKMYIGQTRTLKLTRGKFYKYGIKARLSEHRYSATQRSTPLCKAIKKYGIEDFEAKEIVICDLTEASETESFYIDFYKTLVPNGYNKQKVSRSYKTKVDIKQEKEDYPVQVVPLKQNKKYRWARIYVYKGKGKANIERINFNRKKETFEQNYQRAIKYANQISDEVTIKEPNRGPQQAAPATVLVDTVEDKECNN